MYNIERKLYFTAIARDVHAQALLSLERERERKFIVYRIIVALSLEAQSRQVLHAIILYIIADY